MGPVEQSNFISRSSARPPPFYSLPPSPAPSPSPFLSPFPSPPAPRLSSTPSLTTPHQITVLQDLIKYLQLMRSQPNTTITPPAPPASPRGLDLPNVTCGSQH